MFSTFYHSIIRKTVTSFGTLFNNIYVERTDEQSNKVQKIKIPLTYASKERMFQRLNISVDSQQTYSTQIVLPRLSFAITGIEYDAERKRNLIQKRYSLKPDESVQYHYSEVPYNIQFSLYVYVRNVDDGLQIIEQILPYFNPQFNITIKPSILEDQNEKLDIPIVLGQVIPNENYEGNMKDDLHRILTWELQFIAKVQVYGPVRDTGLIENADINIHTWEE
jgi:hypothetical protein